MINYDGDQAGIKAARRAIEHLLPQEFDIKVLVLPDGKDPDDFVRENGRDGYDQLRGKAEPFLAFALRLSLIHIWPDSWTMMKSNFIPTSAPGLGFRAR